MREAWWLVILLAGCLQPMTPGVAPDPVSPYEPYDAFTWSGQDCDAAMAAFLPEYGAVRPWLPAGFAPGDAAGAIGAGVAAGRALVLVALLQCLDGTSVSDDLLHATTSVLVMPPRVADDDDEDNRLHFYDVSHTATDWLWNELTFRGWKTHHADQEMDVELRGMELAFNGTTPFRVAIEYLDSTGGIEGMIHTGATYAETRWDTMFWRVAQDRLLALHLDYEQAPVIGDIQCTFVETPTVHRFLPDEQRSCRGPVPALGALLPGFDFVATLTDEGPWP